ncbi:CcdA-like protein [Enterobacterales bacterium]|nr:CcdA-like protein [Enterobacterales bacterium]
MSTTVKAVKRTVSLTIDDDLYQRARMYNLNLSQRLSEAITQELQQLERLRWKEENREGLLEINRINAQCGHFGGEHRKF